MIGRDYICQLGVLSCYYLGMKIVYVEASEGDAETLRARFSEAEVIIMDDELTSANVPAAAADADVLSVFVGSKVDKAVMKAMPNLKLIATRSTGFDHIDMKFAKKRKIVVSNVPTYGENTVAEHTFALILALSRKIFQSYDRTERYDFDREGLTGFDLKGKTLGVVGCGHIGQHVIKAGLGLGMNILMFDAHHDEALASQEHCTYADSLDELLGESDVITLHVPYMKATHHLINKDTVSKIKRGAILINTARGGLVDTEALLWALNEGILSGAGLDVLEEEGDMYEDIEVMADSFPKNKDIATLLANHILISRKDVIITPHNAFNSVEALERIFNTTAKNIEAFVDGEPANVVG